jgi:hypothetical protein
MQSDIQTRRFVIERKRRFNYLKDTLFISSIVLYLLNRWILKPVSLHHTTFFSSFLNDIICIPFCLPPVLLLTRIVKLRDNDEPPDIYELGFYVLLWSLIFEIICPAYGKVFNYTVSDPWDIVCYCVGALLGGFYWNFKIVAFRGRKR